MAPNVHAFASEYDHIVMPVLTLDDQQRVVKLNRAAKEYAGKFISDLQEGVDFPSLIEGGEKLRFDRGAQTATARGNQQSRLAWHLFSTPVVLDGGRHGHDLLIVDQAELERSKEYEFRYQQLLEVYVDPILIHQDMRIVFMNEVAEDMLGGPRHHFIGESIFAFVHPGYRDAVHSRLQQLMATNTRTELREIQVYNLQKELLDVEVASTIITYNGSPAILTTMRNITDRKRAQQEVVHLAYHDELTGLPNRRKINQELPRWIGEYGNRSGHFAVITMDVDRLKIINDSLGHQYGDLLLIEISRRIKTCVDESGRNHLFGRWSSDEFVLLIECSERREELSAVLNQMETVLQRPYLLKDDMYYTSSSIGIAVFPHDGADAGELLRNADLAMYKQKKKGKNGYCFFSSDLAMRFQERMEMENDLRRSLECGELKVYYQPQFDAGTNQMIGIEALIRWIHPAKGLIPAGDFIPVAEETGLILDIGHWVLSEACRDMKKWQDEGGPRIPVWVNLSSMQFQQPNLIRDIRQILQETGLEPQYLGIEITESMTMDAVLAEGILKELQGMGIQISLDDFGTGYSSLSYLQRFAIHKLKIDRSFIKDISTNQHDQAIVSTIITMAKNLNLGVIAEGIETKEQLEFLTRAGCSHIQGYYFSRPEPLSVINQRFVAFRNQ